MTTCLLLLAGMVGLVLLSRWGWPRFRDWLIRTPDAPAAWREFAAATLTQGGVAKMAGYLVLLPFIDWRLPRPIVTWLCRTVGRQQGIDFAEVERPLETYETLDAFFVRGICPARRPFDDAPFAVLSPADAEIVGVGAIEAGTLWQAKGMPYALTDLLPAPEAEQFIGGDYVSLYLRPSDCHRVFSPLDGAVRAAVAVPGGEMPVSDSARSSIPRLYVQNKRVAHLLETSAGAVALIMIGAYKVGRIEARYDSTLRIDDERLVRREYAPPPSCRRGEWLATFHLGSSIVLLFEPGRFQPDANLVGRRVRYGARLGLRRNGPVDRRENGDASSAHARTHSESAGDLPLL